VTINRIGMGSKLDETVFRERLQRGGYDEVGIVEWEAGKVSDSRRHDFDAYGLVLSSALTVTTGNAAMVCAPGETFTVAANTPPTETVGANGAQVLIGCRA
jgi:quercetin dioxygenase-like cupin family protein